MLTETGLLHVADEAPLVMLVKTLAKQMDADPSSTRTQQAYLSALKDVRRVLNAAVVPSRGRSASATAPEPEAPLEQAPEVPPDNLLQFEQRHGIA